MCVSVQFTWRRRESLPSLGQVHRGCRLWRRRAKTQRLALRLDGLGHTAGMEVGPRQRIEEKGILSRLLLATAFSARRSALAGSRNPANRFEKRVGVVHSTGPPLNCRFLGGLLQETHGLRGGIVRSRRVTLRQTARKRQQRRGQP